MKLLDNRLRKSNVSPELYRLHGLFGSADEDNRLSLEVTKANTPLNTMYTIRNEAKNIPHDIY